MSAKKSTSKIAKRRQKFHIELMDDILNSTPRWLTKAFSNISKKTQSVILEYDSAELRLNPQKIYFNPRTYMIDARGILIRLDGLKGVRLSFKTFATRYDNLHQFGLRTKL